MITNKFWPLDFDPEGAIYENPSWDLPGLLPKNRPVRKRVKRTPKSSFSH